MGRSYHCTERERTLIRQLVKRGESQREIATILGRKSCVLTGRPRKTTARDDSQIKRLSNIDPFKSGRMIRDELNLSVSYKTVQRRLVEKQLHGRSPRQVPMLTRKHLQARLKFAKEHMDWIGPENGKKWRNILWSDESKVNFIGSNGKRWVHRPVGSAFKPQYTVKTFKHGGGCIMVWACFSWYGVGPIFWIKKIMDQYLYLEILENTMLPYAEWEMPLKW